MVHLIINQNNGICYREFQERKGEGEKTRTKLGSIT